VVKAKAKAKTINEIFDMRIISASQSLKFIYNQQRVERAANGLPFLHSLPGDPSTCLPKLFCHPSSRTLHAPDKSLLLAERNTPGELSEIGKDGPGDDEKQATEYAARLAMKFAFYCLYF
jgi:hypothetical protein